MESKEVKAYAIKPEDKLPRAIAAGRRISISLANSEMTGGILGMTEAWRPPGWDTGYHINHNEDEGFFILEGTVTFYAEGAKVEATPGTWVFGPRGRPHRYTITGDKDAHFLILNVPAGFEGFIQQGAPAKSLTPQADKTENLRVNSKEQQERLASEFREYNIEALDYLPRIEE